MSAPLLIGLLFLALIVGPLASIVVDRAVERETLRAEHRCVHCGTGLGPTTLIPIVHWSTRCHNCRRSKGWRYPLVDLTLAVTFVALGWRFGWSILLAPYLLLAVVLVVLSAIDVETHLLPNIIMWPAIIAGIFLILVISGESGYGPGINSALLGGAVFGGFIGAAHLVYERGMGRGDVKLALLLGLFVGWIEPGLVDTTRLVLVAILLALVGGAAAGLIYNIVAGRGRAEIPFGPALAAAGLAVVILAPSPLPAIAL